MNVNIPGELSEAVKQLAAREGVPPAEIVRRALVIYVATERKIDEELNWDADSDAAWRDAIDDVEKDW